MSRGMKVFLSDLHIGTNAETNWFQGEVHGELIRSVLDYIVQNAELIDDVVILGDWFELWNYSPDSTAPDLETIFSRHPHLFNRTPDKRDFVSALEAIKGNFRFVNGDHDMTVPLAEINRLFSQRTDKPIFPGHGTSLEKNPLSNNYYKDGLIWAEHGNQNDLFNSPAINDENPCQPLPLGYFVNRMYCHYIDKQISSMHRRNASCISGCPSSEGESWGVKPDAFFEQIVKKMISGQSVNAAELVLENLMSRNRSQHLEFNMKAMGLGFIDSFDVPKFYPNLINSNNLMDSAHEIEVACTGLGNFARRHFCTNPGCRLVVMGHTHQAAFEVFGAGQTKVFANLGYLCPSQRDMNSGVQQATFLVVREDERAMKVTQMIVNHQKNDIVEGPSHLIEK